MIKKILLTFLLISISIVSHAAEKKFITKKEFLDSNIKKLEQQFDQIDSNKDQKITALEEKAYIKQVQEARLLRVGLAKLADVNKDGKITPEEEKILLTKMDTNKDGSVTFKEQTDYYKKNGLKIIK